MGVIIDTCIFTQQEKSIDYMDLSMFAPDEEIYISVISVSELLVGVHRADTENRKLKRSAFVETILGKIPALAFTENVARVHAELYAYMLKEGNIIGAHDLIIASTSLFYDCSLLTHNMNEFKRVPGLKLHSV